MVDIDYPDYLYKKLRAEESRAKMFAACTGGWTSNFSEWAARNLFERCIGKLHMLLSVIFEV